MTKLKNNSSSGYITDGVVSELLENHDLTELDWSNSFTLTKEDLPNMQRTLKLLIKPAIYKILQKHAMQNGVSLEVLATNILTNYALNIEPDKKK